MRNFFVLLKHILQGTLIALVSLYALLYILLSIPGVQNRLRNVGEDVLEQYLGVAPGIGRIEISPFNKVELFGVFLPDQRGDTLLYAHKVAASIDLPDLTQGRIRFSNIQLFGLDLRISRDTVGAPTNMQFVIDAFTDTVKPRKETAIDLAMNSVLVRRSNIRYDVLSSPRKPAGTFDAHHIAVSDLLATVSLRRFNRDTLNLYVKRLAFKERSGLGVERLTLRLEANRRQAVLSQLLLEHGGSRLSTDTAGITFPAEAGSFADSAQFIVRMDKGVLLPADFAPLLPVLRDADVPVALAFCLEGTPNSIATRYFTLSCADGALRFDTSFSLNDITSADSLSVDCHRWAIETHGDGLSRVADYLPSLSPAARQMLDTLGNVYAEGSVGGRMPNFDAHMRLSSGVGGLQASAFVDWQKEAHSLDCRASVATEGIDLASLLGEATGLGMVAFDFDATAVIAAGRKPSGHISGTVGRADYKGYSYRNILVDASLSPTAVKGQLQIDDPHVGVTAGGMVQLSGKHTAVDVQLQCCRLDLDTLHLSNAYPGYRLSFGMEARYHGTLPDRIDGYVRVDSLFFANGTSQVACNHFCVTSYNDTLPQRITIASDYINGEITGEYTLTALPRSLHGMLATLLPSVVPQGTVSPASPRRVHELANDISWHFTINPDVEMSRILRLPFTLTDHTVIEGYIKDLERTALLRASLPNLWVGNNHIEDASVYISRKDGKLDYALHAGLVNRKKVATLWSVSGNIADDRVSVGVNWNTNTTATYCGAVRLDTRLTPCSTHPGATDLAVSVQPTQFIINDTVWNIKPANILVHDKNIIVDRLELSRPSQHIYIEGVASDNPADTMHIDLRDINLDYIFETLNIDYVTFGGHATGRVNAANLFSPAPYLATEVLDVRDFSYNDAVFGDISLMSMWNNDNKGILLKGIIDGHHDNKSYVDGYIFPMDDSLSIDFDVDHLPLAFIRPFVGTVLNEVDGSASGRLTLGGNFKRIFLTGDAYAHDFSFGVPFLNTRYYVTDSVHFRHDNIWFRDVTARDGQGHTARASGILQHRYFANLRYDIDIYDADNLLVFNIPPTPGASFYGTIYGTGGVAIKGDDYRTDIGVNMLTEDDSHFTFVLTNTASAADYSFLTFTNSSAQKKEQHHSEWQVADSTVIRNNRLMEEHTATSKPKNVLYLTLQADVTPQADITLVMDEVMGDKMEARGEGSIRVEYNTSEDDIGMYGSYTVSSGQYNFSLQDIITRDFTITQGSTVSFRGSPTDAVLDINAVYSLQANLADLDESFVTDGELTRTTVPVHTILKIQGNLSNPNIGFDIELPTVSADVDSKMRSIISTDEMMTRQIIYLLALNRFFTPDYNTGQNGNNEWVSMASSTISSSLGSLLGQISENWNISPNFRSDKGDFSDMEVDLVLSSQLLNNRLIFNGNFGYRDKRYNSTNFVGDFDIEYLLTESGNLRLKGYNHFNDRNYSMRTALTTQGVGIMYTHEFDSWLNFFDRKPHEKEKQAAAQAADSVAVQPRAVEQVADSMAVQAADSVAVQPRVEQEAVQAADSVAVQPRAVEQVADSMVVQAADSVEVSMLYRRRRHNLR